MAMLDINGKTHDVQVEADTPLLWVIREQVGLTGTKYGCGVAQCGACSVHINGEVKRSCAIPVSSVKSSDKIVTIEGLSATSSHPVQKNRPGALAYVTTFMEDAKASGEVRRAFDSAGFKDAAVAPPSAGR